MTTTTPDIINYAPRQRTISPITQTLAILHDAYRELNAKRMFWIVLILSAVAIGAFAVVSVTPDGLSVAGYKRDTGFVSPGSLYKWMFSWLMITIWLTWAATILAIVSTAGIFPDFLTGGSIDLYLCKPISRLRLFVTKYLAAMLFVILQTTTFSVIAFFVVGIRGKIWEPGLFLAIPIITLFFSYLYSACVLLGVLTRSSIAALLLTILLWAIIFGIHTGEIYLLATKNVAERHLAFLERQLQQIDATPATTIPATRPSTKTSPSFLSSIAKYFQPKVADANIIRRERYTRRIAELQHNIGLQRLWHNIVYPIKLIGPKTTETVDLLDRVLIGRDEFTEFMSAMNENSARRRVRDDGFDDGDGSVNREVELIKRSRSLSWVVGTSLGFEAIVLSLAAWLFCRRDF